MEEMMSNIVRRIAAGAVLACTLLFLAGCTQETTVSVTESQKTGPSITVTHKIIWDPPGSYLVGFDANQAFLNLSLTNAAITTTSGTATVSVKDLTTGLIVGQQNFGFVVNGNSIYAQDPTAVYNWLQQFTGYANIDVIVDVATTLNTLSEGSASSTGSAVYLGVPYASATAGWSYTGGGGGSGCHTRICPNE